MPSNEMEVAKPAQVVDIVSTAVPIHAVTQQIQMVVDCMRQNMRRNVHYGTIPGTPKPSLWQPGADIINVMFRLRPEFEVVSAVRQNGLIAYAIRCRLTHIPSGTVLGDGLGTCNTREQKYERTITKRQCDIWELDNTIFKMACKRAKIAATLNATAATEVFTQDHGDEPDMPDMPANTSAAQADRRRGKSPKTVMAGVEANVNHGTTTNPTPAAQSEPQQQDLFAQELPDAREQAEEQRHVSRATRPELLEYYKELTRDWTHVQQHNDCRRRAGIDKFDQRTYTIDDYERLIQAAKDMNQESQGAQQ